MCPQGTDSPDSRSMAQSHGQCGGNLEAFYQAENVSIWGITDGISTDCLSYRISTLTGTLTGIPTGC